MKKNFELADNDRNFIQRKSLEVTWRVRWGRKLQTFIMRHMEEEVKIN